MRRWEFLPLHTSHRPGGATRGAVVENVGNTVNGISPQNKLSFETVKPAVYALEEHCGLNAARTFRNAVSCIRASGRESEGLLLDWVLKVCDLGVMGQPRQCL